MKNIDFSNISTSKDISSKYYIDYANNELVPFFSSIKVSDKTVDTDKLALNLMLYIIQHYEAFDTYCTVEDKQKLLFSICKTVPFLTNKIISGGNIDGLVDKYAIRRHYGFEDNNIFRDLKYLQKVTAYDHQRGPQQFSCRITPEEIDGMLSDVGSLKSIILLELDGAKTEDIKGHERQQYLDVTKYPNIFSLAAFYREQERLQDARVYVTEAIETLKDQSNPELCLFVVLRAITVVGEFSTQKNLAFQTRLNNPEFTKCLEQIKNITNKIVKPDHYTKFAGAVITGINLDALSQELDFLLTGLNALSTISLGTSYSDRVAHYTAPTAPKQPYLSEELRMDLEDLVGKTFPTLSPDRLHKVSELLLSEKSEKFIQDILRICEPSNEQKREIFIKNDGLIAKVRDYKPPLVGIPTPTHTTEVEKLVPLLQDDTSTKPTSLSIRELLATLDGFMKSSDHELPHPIQDDNPICLSLEALKAGDTVTGGAVLMRISQGIPSHTVIIPYTDDRTTSIEHAIKSIKTYNNNSIAFPRNFFGVGGEFITRASVDFSKFEEHVSGNAKQVLDYIINYGKYCTLYQFVKEGHNRSALEFLLQTSYSLLKDAIQEGVDAPTFPKEEYRALRDSIRHFEDNFDITEVQTPIEQIYVHYAVRFLGEAELWLEMEP